MKCPQCAGLGFGFSFVRAPKGEIDCHWCKGTGQVTPAKAEKFKRARAAAKKRETN